MPVDHGNAHLIIAKREHSFPQLHCLTVTAKEIQRQRPAVTDVERVRTECKAGSEIR